MDGKPPLSLESTRFFLPRSMKDEMPCNILTDIFALGSSLYQIMIARQPYEELSDEEVEAIFARREFPSVENIACGAIIRKCWMCCISSSQAVHDALKIYLREYRAKLE